MPPDGDARQLRDYVAVLRRRRWIVVAATVLVMGAALVLSLFQSRVYEGRARILIQPTQSLFDTSAPATDQNLVQNEIQVMQSQPVLAAVKDKLGGRPLPPLSVVAVGQTSVVEVRAQSPSPSVAATATNAYADAYVDYSHKQTVAAVLAAGQEIQSKIDDVQKQIDALSARLATIPTCAGNSPPPNCGDRDPVQQDRDALVSQLVPLKQKLNEFQLDASYVNGGPRLITPAAVPTAPIRPTPKRNTILGLGVGLVFGAALAFAFEHFDDSIKSKEDLERCAKGLPVLGLIPSVGAWKNREETYVVARENPTSPAAEAYRTLRTSIHFLALDRSVRVLQVTSPNASEGKSTAVANLAVVLARAGERVVVVSCDLRRPRIHQFFGLPNAEGFTSVLLGKANLASVLQPVPGEDRLLLLSAGPLPPNPSELLASSRTSGLMSALKSAADIILLDCPPVLPVTDAAVLSAHADAVLLVANAGSTSAKHVGRAIELLRQVGAPLTGAVLNGVSAEGAYGYAYQYYSREEAGNGNGHSPSKLRKQPTKP